MLQNLALHKEINAFECQNGFAKTLRVLYLLFQLPILPLPMSCPYQIPGLKRSSGHPSVRAALRRPASCQSPHNDLDPIYTNASRRLSLGPESRDLSTSY
jgi:hypothetical protein